MELIGTGIRGQKIRPVGPGIGPIGINLVQESLNRHILADMLDDEYDKNQDLFDLEHMKIEALILQKNTMEIISPGIHGPSIPSQLMTGDL